MPWEEKVKGEEWTGGSKETRVERRIVMWFRERGEKRGAQGQRKIKKKKKKDRGKKGRPQIGSFYFVV